MKIVIYFLLSMFATQSFAGDKINNGGGLWACVANNVIQSAQLVDLYEARAEFGLVPTVPTSTDVMTLVSERANFISMNFPELGNQLLADV